MVIMLQYTTNDTTMLPDIKLVIIQNDKVIQSITKKVETSNFVKAIENLQELANAILTKLIDDHGGSGNGMIEDEREESDTDEDIFSCPKKIKK